jgi:hypothetical protein
MNSEASYNQILFDYSQKVQALFASPGDLVGERGGRGPASFEDLAIQAQDLIVLSDRLNQATSDELAQALPEKRIQHGTSLMAKSLIDLEISAKLLEAALDQEANQSFRSTLDEERGAGTRGQLDLLLDWMKQDQSSDDIDEDTSIERTTGSRLNPIIVRTTLQGSIEDGLELITSRAGRLSQDVVFGLISLDGLNLPSLLNQLASGISGAADVVASGKQLLELYQAYVIRSIETLQRYVGKQATEVFIEQAISWVNPIKDGQLMTPILKVLFGVAQSEESLIQLINSSQQEPRFFHQAAHDIDRLLVEHQRQIQLGERLNSGLGVLGSVSSAFSFPVGGTLLTVGKVILGAFIVTASGDYLDAPGLKLLNRVAGIPSLVESRLVDPVMSGDE